MFPKIGVSQNGWFYNGKHLGGGNSKIFWNFHPDLFGEDEPIFDEHIFQRGLVQPPTRNG